MKKRREFAGQKQVGDRVGMLTLTARRNTPKGLLFECLCDCGKTTVVRHHHLKVGTTSSCGCNWHTRGHGHASGGKLTPEYISWLSMRQRCGNEKHEHYHLYGGRGVLVCERWRDSFENFLSDMGLKPEPKHELDRIEVNGNYDPSNCRWATKKQNSRNRRTNRVITANGVSRCAAEWSEVSGVKASVILSRIRRGWPAEKAIAAPIRKDG